MKTRTIRLPDEVDVRLQHAAHGNERRVGQVAVQMLRTALPPDDSLSQDIQQELRVLESLSDDALWVVARSKMAVAKQRRWKSYFAWSHDGTRIIGTTPPERATVQALRMNDDLIMRARQRRVQGGWWPPGG